MPPNPTVTRRRNALALFQAFAETELAAGGSPKGLEQAFASRMQISPSMWSQVKAARPIGDKLARQLEAHAGKAPGWLDEARESAVLTPGEKAFVDLALATWRATNAVGRKALKGQMKAVLDRQQPQK